VLRTRRNLASPQRLGVVASIGNQDFLEHGASAQSPLACCARGAIWLRRNAWGVVVSIGNQDSLEHALSPIRQ
jgi:hypothetical protein